MTVNLAINGAIATITLNRPEKKNALTVEMREGLIAHLQAVRFDDNVRALILTGAEGHFCAGGDVRAVAQSAAGEKGNHGFWPMRPDYHSIFLLSGPGVKPVLNGRPP